jgi:DNA-binding CsgD family transcriptional regulator
LTGDPPSLPPWAGAHAEQIIAARGDEARLNQVLRRGPVPMVIVDDDRRYVEANAPARSALRLSLADLRRLRLDDLTPPYRLPAMKASWARLMETGYLAWPHPNGDLDAGYRGVAYFALANALPGLHLIAFALGGWLDSGMLGELAGASSEPTSRLTPRELEVLELAAAGYSGPMIARRLNVSPSTVRTHFEHIYAKLAVRDRATAVAQAMRLGLIA